MRLAPVAGSERTAQLAEEIAGAAPRQHRMRQPPQAPLALHQEGQPRELRMSLDLGGGGEELRQFGAARAAGQQRHRLDI